MIAPGNPQQAIAKLKQAAAQRPSAHMYSQIGMEYGKMGKYPEALDALDDRQRLEPELRHDLLLPRQRSRQPRQPGAGAGRLPARVGAGSRTTNRRARLWLAWVVNESQRQMMRIGVNALYLIPGGVGGTEIYLRNLLRALAEIDAVNQYVVFTNRETGADLVPDRPNFVHAPQAVERPISAGAHSCGSSWFCRSRFANIGWIVLFNPGFTAPLLCGCPMVTVFHDLQHKRHPEYFRWFDLPFWNFFLWASARRSRGVIAVSQATRDDLQRYYGTRCPSDPSRRGARVLRDRADIANRKIICCASPPRIRTRTWSGCCACMRQTKNAPQLIVTGVRGFAAQEIEGLAASSVEFTGWIPREQLYELYRGALGFIYPSTFEGFGMPVLEAMAAGVPVACSDIPPLREIARSTVHFFDPASDREIRDALLLLGVRKISTDAAQHRAAQFTWEKTARATLDYLSKCSS